MYIIILDSSSDTIEIEKCFNTFEEAREYVNKVVNERKDLFSVYDDFIGDDTFVFENDDVYYIRYCDKG